MMVGMVQPTSGKVLYNKSLLKYTDYTQNIGYCPQVCTETVFSIFCRFTFYLQYNILFDDITVEEHIWIYHLLKG